MIIDTNDSRDRKAILLAAQASGWYEVIPGKYRMVSSAGSQDIYTVTVGSCTCPDNQRGNVCKHRRAVQLFLTLREIQP